MGRIGGVRAAMMLMGLGVAQPSFAQQSVLSAAGFTGYSSTPTAHLMPWGSMGLAYDNQIVGGPKNKDFQRFGGTSGHNYVAGFGVFPFLEISGRLASNSIRDNCYATGCGIRDLSFGLKAGLSLDRDKQWHAAVGATDFGGQVTYFRTFYGVLSYSPGLFDFSAGYAKKGDYLKGESTPLDGIFGSAAYRPLSWAQFQIEYNNNKAWAGLRLFSPPEFLPPGWTAHIGVNSRIYGTERSEKSWINFGLTVPLYKVPVTQSRTSSESNLRNTEGEHLSGRTSDFNSSVSKKYLQEFSAEGLEKSLPVESNHESTAVPALSDSVKPFVVTKEIDDSSLLRVAEELRIKGFEDISVGRMANGSVAVRVNNATYNVNAADGLGVALGVIARHLAATRIGYSLVLTQRQVALVGVTGYSDCLSDWILMKSSRCAAGELHTPGTSDVSRLVDGASWIVDGRSPSWATARLILQPVLNSGIATEYGVFDYSVGLRATFQQPLWKGAYVELGHVFPISESSDYKPGGAFVGSRLANTTDRIMFHQIIRVPIEKIFSADSQASATRWGANALTAHVAAGQINSNYRGTYGELRWEPFEGNSKFGLEGGRFERTTFYDFFLPIKSQSLLASYRYSFRPTKTDFEVTAGQFLYNDRGAQLLVTQWFDDVSLSFYLRRTKFNYENSSRTFAGIEISIPLTPRKDMTPEKHIQIVGAPQWFYGIETRVGNTNFVGGNQGVFPGVAVLDRTFNYDRAAVSYFEDNMARIRSAAGR